MRPQVDKPKPGQESVWDYPRPPALQPVSKPLKVVHAGRTIAETSAGYRVLETSHPPVYYFPAQDCQLQWLSPAPGSSFCEWKGMAKYFDLSLPLALTSGDATGSNKVSQVAWYYPAPTRPFAPIARYLAFYASKVDACYVGDELANPQPGGFYGGWVTHDLAGPFKGIPGSMGW